MTRFLSELHVCSSLFCAIDTLYWNIIAILSYQRR
jgi:hypothetical protein